MDYRRVYKELMARARSRQIKVGVYCERHHEVPKCHGGSNYRHNIVELFPEEHLFAHRLLMRIYPADLELAFAFFRLLGLHRDPSRPKSGLKARQLYKVEREQLAKLQSLRRRGTTMPESAKEAIRQANTGRPCPQHVKDHLRDLHKGKPGKKLTPEHVAKLKAVNTGRKVPEEHKEKLRARFKGVPLSADARANIAAAARTRKKPVNRKKPAPLTPEQRERHRQAMARMRKEYQ